MKRILVLGGTGLLGEAVVRHLCENGHEVRLLVRNGEKAAVMFGRQVEILAGDVLDRQQLLQAMTDCQAVHISLDGAVERPAVENVAALAAAAGIERIGYVSGVTVCEENRWFPYAAEKYKSEQILLACGVPTTIFAPSWFFEMLGNFVKFGRAIAFGRHKKPYHFMAVDDFGHMAAAAYDKEEAANQRFIMLGPEEFLFHEALRRYCAALHPKIKKVTTLPYWLAKLIARMRHSEEMAWAVHFMRYFERVREQGDPQPAYRILGGPQVILDDWLEEKRRQKE